jgi:hypothetical protein
MAMVSSVGRPNGMQQPQVPEPLAGSYDDWCVDGRAHSRILAMLTMTLVRTTDLGNLA